jgi:8-oxoguanine deaminase
VPKGGEEGVPKGGKGVMGLSAREALWMATRGGAAVLGRDDVGQLAPGKAADFIGLRLDRLAYAGALHDPLAALVFCAPQRVDLSVINGRVVVEDGQLLTINLGPVIERHNQISRALVEGA